MADIFRRSYTQPVPADAELIDVNGIPSAKFKQRGKRKATIAPLTDDGKRVRISSPFWYARIKDKIVKLFTDEMASRQRVADLVRKSERLESGVADPLEDHRRRTLADHLKDWADNHRNRSKERAAKAAANVRRILDGCKFERLADVSPVRLERFLVDLRKNGAPLPKLDPTKDAYTKAELAAALGVDKLNIPSLVRRHRLAAVGKGKARRYPRGTVEALRQRRGHGLSIKTSNEYLGDMKAFLNFMVLDRRATENPIAHLKKLNAENDKRHDRRFLDDGELARVIGAAADSAVVFRELAGVDRAMLYRVACTTGLRAGELAALCPWHFNLNDSIVTLPGANTKNKKAAEQPLPPEVAELLRGYLGDKPAGKPIWPGTWHERAADMLRIDLDAAGIPYVVDGPDGPLHADFHCLRHSYVALLDRSGATLKEAMQLARHSDPKLTMKIYGKARRHDLAGAVERFPSLEKKEMAPSGRRAQ